MEEIWVSHIYMNDGLQFSSHEIFMLSHRNNSQSVHFPCALWLFDIVQSVLNYVRTFQLEYSVTFLEDLTRNITWDTAAFQIMQDASLRTCVHYYRITKL